MKTRSLLFVCALVALSIAAVASAGPDSAPLPAAPDTSSWQALPAPGGHPIQALATSPAFLDDQTLFAATSGGIYRSNDAGQSWTLLGMGPTGIISDTTKIVPSPAYPADGTLFVITRFVAPEPPSPKSQRVMDGALFGITQAAESVDGRVLRSTDAGATWQAVWASAVVHDLVVSPNYAVDGTLFFSAATAPYGRPQIYRSTDRGDNWLPTANQPGEGDDTYLDPYLLAISPDYGADQTLFAAGYGAIHRSTDGGATWQGLRVTGPNYSVALSPHFATDRTIWAMYREVEASVMQPEAGIVRSTDGGATWRNVTAGLDGNYNQNYRSLAPDPTGQVVYLALAGPEWSEHFPPRVYRSDNAGLSWAPQALLPGGAAPRQVLAPGPLPHLFALADGVAYRYNSTCYEILADGGFETDPELLAYGITPAWEIPGTAHPAVYTMDLKLAGGWAMRSGIRPGDPNVLSYSDFRQRINIPADATSAVLRFWRYPIFGDSAAAGAVSVPAGGWLAAGPDAPDYQYVLARFDDDGYEMLSTWRDNDHSWLETEINLLGQRGKNFRVQWGVFNNGIDGTSAMFVDEASVTICRPAMSGKVAVYLPMLLYDPGIPMMPTLTPTPTPSLTPSPSSTPTRTPTVTITPTPTSTWTFPTTLRELIVAPGAPGPLYALTNSQLLLVSYDRGESWQAAPQGVPVAVGRAGLGMDYANPSTLYLGTQAGLFRTDANGQWQFLHTVRTHALSVEYNRPTTLWAAPNIGHDFGSGVMVIKSDDGGQIWRSASDGLQGWTAANPIIIDPDDPNTLYISTATKYGSGVLHRGTNAGNWRWLPGPTFGWNVNTGLAFDNGANALYMGSRYLGQLWRSLNANTPAPEDVTWQLVHDFGANTSVVPLAVGWGPAGAAIYINLTDTTDWSTQLLRSDDDGATWRPLNLPPGPPPPPSNQYQLIVNGYPAVRQIADYRSQDRYATSFAGLHRKIGYNDWTLVNNAAPRPKFVYSPANSSLIWAGLTQMCLAGGPDEPMYKSDDGGRTWRELPSGLNIQPVVAHPTDPLRVYGFGCDGVYLTSDGGATWQRQASDLWLTYFVSDIAAVDPAWTTVYASGISEGGGGMLARSTDGGATWQRVTPLYEDIWWITDVWVDPANANRVYFVEPKGVWRSLDAGATWQRFTAGLGDILYDDGRQPYGLLEIVSDLSDPSRLYLGTAAGLYESSNFGANWHKLSGYSWDDQPVDGLLADGSNGVWLNSPDGAFYLYFGYPPASPTPTPTATTVAGCWEGFVNGGFETDAGWTIRSNPVLAGYVTSPVRSGSRSMRTGIPAGGANVASYSPVEQSVSFPAGVTSATLSFWRYNVNGDVGAAAAGWQPDPALLPRTEAAQAGNIQAADYFYVLAILPNGTIDYLFTETANAPSWRSRAITLNVSRYAGKTIRFQFGTYNNGTGGISRTFVDDVALTLCSAAITATPTATRTPTPTATRTATPTPTRTATPTATATSVAGCWEGFVNGGFETNAGWTIRSNPVLAGYVTAPVRSGSRSMRTGIPAGGANVASYSPVEQSVSFPAGVTSATLSFWRYNVNGDVGAAAAAWQPDPALLPRTEAAQAGNIQAADYFYVLAILPNGTIDYLFTEAVNAPSWRSRAITLNASRYAGKTIRFQFGTYNNGTGGISRTFVDDAALTLCSTGVGASPTPTATATGVPATIPTAAPGFVATPYWAGRLNLPAGSRPHGLVVSEDGKRVYVAFHGIDHTGRTLGVINEYLSLQAQIDLGPEAQGPNGVALIPSSGRVVVANRQTANATLVDVADGVVLGHVAANTMPDGVIVHGGYGYIANYGNDTVTVFDPATLAVIRTLHGVGHEPALFAADSMSNDVYLSAHGSNQVFVLRDGQVGAHWDGIPEPYGLSYDAASRRLYVANRGAHHTVTVLDIYHDWVVGTIPVAKEAFVLFVNPESGHLFVACGDEVKIYDTYDWSLVTSIPVPAGAEEGIAFDARLSKVFVTSWDSDALTVIQDLGPGRVVFASSRDGNSEIYRMLPDGRQQQRLTFTADASENAPVGSLDGRWIAYERTDAGSPTYTQIWLMSRDGRGATMLTDGPFNNLHPTWSADSRKLALASDRDGDWEIYTLDLATLGLTKLTDNTWFDGQPDWSKPAGRIAFVSNRNTPNGEIFTMAADGSDVRQLTASVNGDASPSWEPGGNRLVFWGSRPEGQGLYMTHSDGSDVRLLVPQALLPSWPTWGLLGDTIVFSGYRPGNGYSEIMRIEVDGSGLVLLTNNELDFDYAPGYLPGY